MADNMDYYFGDLGSARVKQLKAIQEIPYLNVVIVVTKVL